MEVYVRDRVFEAPVFVKDGKHLIQEIHSLDDALDFLEEWPLNRREDLHLRIGKFEFSSRHIVSWSLV